jgi:hypothetical protein
MPFVLAPAAFTFVQEPLQSEHLLQSGEPEMIIVEAVVACRLCTDFLGQQAGPFRPGENPPLVQMQGHGKGLGLPWLGEDATILVARQAG